MIKDDIKHYRYTRDLNFQRKFSKHAEKLFFDPMYRPELNFWKLNHGIPIKAELNVTQKRSRNLS